MSQFPCEDCIVLGICKGRIVDGDIFDFLALSDICSNLRQFLYPGGKTRKDMRTRAILRLAKQSLLKGVPFNDNVDWKRIK